LEYEFDTRFMFIEQAFTGLTERWRYCIGIAVTIIGWQIIGMLPLTAALLYKSESTDVLVSGDLSSMSAILGLNYFLLLLLISFGVGLVFLFLYLKASHQQSITALTTARKKVDWNRIVFSFIIWAGLAIATTLFDIYLSPDDYSSNFKLVPFLMLLVISILMIPIQTSFEEYFIRGYLMQGVGVMAGNRWVPLVFTSLLFGLLHAFNPEVEKLGYGILIYYIGTGLFLGILTLMDDGLELSLGFHAANNLVGVLLLTADWAAFQTDALFIDKSDPIMGLSMFTPLLLIYPVLLFLFSKKYKWHSWKDKLIGPLVTEGVPS